MILTATEIAAARYCVEAVIRGYRQNCVPVPIRKLQARLAGELPNDEPMPDWIDSVEAGRILRLTPRMVRRLGERIGDIRVGRQWVFPRADVEKHAAARSWHYKTGRKR